MTKHVRERDVTVDETLQSSTWKIERRAIEPPRAVDAVPAVRHEGDTTVYPVVEERLVVKRQVVVTAELRISRVVRGRRHRERATLRAEEISVERTGPDEPPLHEATPASSQRHSDQEKAMEKVLVGVFDSPQQMDAACRELRDCGIPGDRVHVRSIDESLRTDVVGEAKESGTGFFDRLLGGAERSSENASQYAEAVRRGACVIVVDGIDDSRVGEAVKVMERHGAFDIDERAARWREQGWKGYDANAPVLSEEERVQERRQDVRTRAPETTPSAQMAASNAAAGQMGGTPAQPAAHIPVVEEELKVGKREVQRGGVRVYTRTTERPVEEQVTLREEHARVERHPVDRPATSAELDKAFEEGSIELRETAEEPVVSKSARVVEEVEVGKDVSTRTETVSDTVRRRDVEVEDVGERPRPDADRSGTRKA